MIKQHFTIEQYWEVIVFYNINYNLFNVVADILIDAGMTNKLLDELYYNMHSNYAKAVTFSNIAEHTSIVLFNQHETKDDYLNSIVHEAEHIKQAMLKAYNVNDIGEPPAYTIGYLVMKMYEVFKTFICDC